MVVAGCTYFVLVVGGAHLVVVVPELGDGPVAGRRGRRAWKSARSDFQGANTAAPNTSSSLRWSSNGIGVS